MPPGQVENNSYLGRKNGLHLQLARDKLDGIQDSVGKQFAAPGYSKVSSQQDVSQPSGTDGCHRVRTTNSELTSSKTFQHSTSTFSYDEQEKQKQVDSLPQGRDEALRNEDFQKNRADKKYGFIQPKQEETRSHVSHIRTIARTDQKEHGQSESESLKQHTVDLTNSLAAECEKTKKLSTEISELQGNLDVANGLVQDAEAKLGRKEAEVQSLISEKEKESVTHQKLNEKMKSGPNEGEFNKISRELKKQQEQNVSAKEEIFRHLEEKKELQKALVDLKAQVEPIERKGTENIDDTVSKLEEQAEELERENKSLKEKIKAEEINVDKYIRKLKEEQAKNESAQKEILENLEEKRELKKAVDDLKAQVKSLEQKSTKHIDDTVSKLEQQAEALKRENRSLKEKAKAEETEVDKYKRKLNDEKRKGEGKDTEIQQLLEDLKRLDRREKAQDNLIAESEQKIKDLEDIISELKMKIKEAERLLTGEKESNKAAISELQGNLAASNGLVQDAEARFESSEQKIQSLMVKGKKKEEELNNISKELREGQERNLEEKRELQKALDDLKVQADKLEQQLEELKRENKSLKEKVKAEGKSIQTSSSITFNLPTELDADQRINAIMKLFAKKLSDARIDFNFTLSPGGSLSTGQPVLVPCIAASRLGSDIEASFTSSKVAAEVKVVLLIFHHLAKHNCRISVPTRDKLHDRSIVDRCDNIVDLVFWESQMYDCAANTKAMEELKQILQQ